MKSVAFKQFLAVMLLAGASLFGVTFSVNAQAETLLSASLRSVAVDVLQFKAGSSIKKQIVSTHKKKKKTKKVKKSRKKVSYSPVKRKSTASASRRAVNPANVPLSLESNAVLVMNERTGEVLYAKNSDQPRPIASITKLMTAMVVLDAHLPMNQTITVTTAEIDRLRNTTSRLSVGSQLTRREMLLIALMSSENRAAAALARAYPGGTRAFVEKMNAKARALGMRSARFYDSTGLNGGNVATPRDLAKMVQAANGYSEIRRFSTWPEQVVNVGRGRQLAYNNSNALVKNSAWDIGVQKTGFINEAGRCLVMQADIRNQPTVIVLLDSQGKYSRIGDANRVKQWLEKGPGAKLLLASK